MMGVGVEGRDVFRHNKSYLKSTSKKKGSVISLSLTLNIDVERSTLTIII